MKEIEKFLLWLIVHIGGVAVGLVSALYHNLNSIWICGLIGVVSSVCFQSCLLYFTNKKHNGSESENIEHMEEQDRQEREQEEND